MNDPASTTAPANSAVTISRDGSRASDHDLLEYRAYLQRSETRLSTLHRVAGAFLGGAGLLTLLPVLFRDTFSNLISGLMFIRVDKFPPVWSISRLLILFPMVVSLILPLWALYLLISDLIKFYFTGHHFGHEGGVTYPRFILSGILVDDKSLLEPGDMISARLQSSVTELLIPRSERARNRLLQEAHAIGECRGVGFYHKGPRKEQALRKFILTYTASLPRTLAQESAKMEASMARHVLRLRVLVMRYAKAFLLTILTTGTTITALVIMDFARPSVHDNLGYGKNEQLISGALTWVGFLAVYAAWGFLAAWLVRRPVAWIYEDLADENALRKTPESIYQFERLTLLLVAASTGTVSVSLWLHALEIRDGNIMWLTGVLTMLLIIPAFVYVGQALMKGRKARSGRHIP